MELSDRDIRARIASGDLVFDPMPEDMAFQPASVDLRLGSRYFYEVLDPTNLIEAWNPPSGMMLGDTMVERVAIWPKQFYLLETLEMVTLCSNLSGELTGKSSLGRLGLIIHCTAGKVDPGWRGRLTLEVTNMSSRAIYVKPGMYICQIAFKELSSPCDRLYGHPDLHSKYQGAKSVMPAWSGKGSSRK